MKNLLIYAILAIIPFISNGQIPLQEAIGTKLLTPSLLSASRQNIARVMVHNRSSASVDVQILNVKSDVHTRNPAGEQLLTVGPGEQKFFPLYLKVPAGNTDSIHLVAVDIELVAPGSSWQVTLTGNIAAEKVSRIICTLPDENILLNKETPEAHLRLHVSNQGNTLKKLVVELEAARYPTAYPPVEFSLAPGSDTTLNWDKITTYRQLRAGEVHYYVSVKDGLNESQVYFYQMVRVYTRESVPQQYRNTSGIPSNTLGIRYEQWEDLRYYSMMGNGQMEEAIGNYGLRYRFDLRRRPYHSSLSMDQFMLKAASDENTFTLGDIYFGQETGIYNRGIQAEVNSWGNTFLSGAYTHSGLLPSTFYNSRKEETITAGIRVEGEKQAGIFRYVYQNDRLVNTNTHLLYGRGTRRLGENGTIEAGLGVSSERFEKEANFDGAAFLNIDFQASRWEISSSNRYSGSSYPFINRGDTHFRQLFTYKPSGLLRYHANVLIQRFTPRYRYLPASSTMNYKTNRGSLGASFYGNRMKYGLSAGAGNNELFAPYLDNSATYRNYEFFVKGNIHFSAPYFSIQLNQEVSRVIPRFSVTPPYYAGITELNTVFRGTYLSLYLNRGALTFFDQANYVLNGFTRNFFLARLFRTFYLRPSLSVKVSADHYRDQVFGYQTSTLALAPEFTWKSFQFRYEAGYRLMNGNEMFLQSFSVFKNFENPMERKYTLQVQAFNDLNGNREQDPGEPPAKDILLGLGRVRMITNGNGEAELKNLPQGTYEVLLLDKRNFSSTKNRFEVLLGTSQTLSIPLHEGVKISGHIQTATNEALLPLATLMIRVSDKETGELLYLPCDREGNFKAALQKGKTYQLSVEPSLIPETHEVVPGSRTITTNSTSTGEIIFTLQKNKRTIIRRQFGNP